MEVRVFGRLGVVNGFLIGADFSDMGGDGGVGVSDTAEEEVVLAGGVSKEFSVVVGDSSERGEADTMGGSIDRVFDRLANDCSALRSFSFTMSVSIFRSDNSSFILCASIRRDSRSCSPTFISSSNMTLLSIV